MNTALNILGLILILSISLMLISVTIIIVYYSLKDISDDLKERKMINRKLKL